MFGYLVAITLSGLAGAGFGLGAIWWAPKLIDVAGYGTLVAFFAVSCPVWTLFSVQDYVLTAVGRATVVPIENLVFSVLKIGLLVAVIFAAVPGGIALSWVVATGLIVLPINLWLLVRLLPAHGVKTVDRAVPITVGAVGRFIGADYVGALFWQAAMMGLPVLVLDRLGAAAAAAYGMVWQFGLALYMVPSGMGQSMIAHSAADPGKVEQARRETVRRGLLLVTPVALVLALGAPLVLAVFGPSYAATGAGALAFIALSAMPNVITAAATSTARVRQRRGVQFGVPTSLSVLTIGLAWLLMPHLGVLAVGLAWLLAQCGVAVVVLITNAPWVPGPPGRWIDAVRRAALLRRVGRDGLRRVGAPADWVIGSHMAGGSETVVVTIGPAGERRARPGAEDRDQRRAVVTRPGMAWGASAWRDPEREAPSLANAAAITEQMALISAGRSTRFKLPTWENAGTPLRWDVRRVVETTTTPRTSDVLGRLATSRSRCWQIAYPRTME